MPTAPKRPCSIPRCPGFATVKGQCAVHGQQRGSAAAQGYGARHRRWRLMVLHRHPLCAGHRPGQHVPACDRIARVADHIRPLPQPNWWDGDWSLENGQGLSIPCHNAKTRREQQA